jgi:hypothetical protein
MKDKPILGHVDVTFLEDNAQSLNGRMYLPEAVESAVQAAQEDLAANRPLTVFATHADGLADDASKMAGRVTQVWRDGVRARAKVEIFATESGRNIAAVLKGGGLRTCSLRSVDFGTGAPREEGGKTLETIRRLRLAGIDFTMQPGLAVSGVDRVALESQGAGPRLWESVQAVVQDLDLPLLSEARLPKSAYAYTPDDTPSHWKLRIDDARHVGGAIAALGTGFRGRKVQIPAAARAAVTRKIRSAWKKFHPDTRAEDMPAIIKEACAEAIYVEIPEWEPCQECQDGNEEACTCPGCENDGACWCCAVLAGDDDDDDVEETMTKEELQRLIAEGVAAAMASAKTEAVHTHVHEHEGLDGETYEHEHAHRHEGTADHEDAGAHQHGHGVTWEQLIHVPVAKLVEAAVAALGQQRGGLNEAGRTHSAATIVRLQGIRKAAHSGVCEALDALCGTPAGEAATEGTVKLQACLTETLEKQRALTEEVATLTEQLKVLEGVNARLTESWREKPKVPREALLPALPESAQAELSTPSDRIHYWADSVSRAVARQSGS